MPMTVLSIVKRFTLLPLIKVIQDLTGQGATQMFDWRSVDFVTDRRRFRGCLHGPQVDPIDGRSILGLLAETNGILLNGHSLAHWSQSKPVVMVPHMGSILIYPDLGLENEHGRYGNITYVCAFRLGFEYTNPQRHQNFDGLKIVVHFKVDACLPYDDTPSTSLQQSHYW